MEGACRSSLSFRAAARFRSSVAAAAPLSFSQSHSRRQSPRQCPLPALWRHQPRGAQPVPATSPGQAKAVHLWLRQHRSVPAETTPHRRHKETPPPSASPPTLLSPKRLARALVKPAEAESDHAAAGLEAWLIEASSCGIAAVQTSAAGLEQDGAAVRAALRLPWSSGQAEGQINRLKLLKRQMYGRASLDLLRRRTLLAA
ncbi:transposase [Azospirillum formosense]